MTEETNGDSNDKPPVLRLTFPNQIEALENLFVVCGFRTQVSDPRPLHWKL